MAEVASTHLNSRRQKTAEVDWSRLIPGESPVPARGSKKPAGSVRPIALEKVSEIASGVVASEQRGRDQLTLPGSTAKPNGPQMALLHGCRLCAGGA